MLHLEYLKVKSTEFFWCYYMNLEILGGILNMVKMGKFWQCNGRIKCVIYNASAFASLYIVLLNLKHSKMIRGYIDDFRNITMYNTRIYNSCT